MPPPNVISPEKRQYESLAVIGSASEEQQNLSSSTPAFKQQMSKLPQITSSHIMSSSLNPNGNNFNKQPTMSTSSVTQSSPFMKQQTMSRQSPSGLLSLKKPSEPQLS